MPKVRLIGPWRPATPEDLVAALGPARGKVATTMELRESHHRIAKMVAAGLRRAEIAERTGYSPARVSQLTAAPAMRELIASYTEAEGEAYDRARDEYYESLFRVRAKANLLIENTLDEAEAKGERLPLRDLLALRADADDRVGYSRRGTNVNINADFGAELEARLAKRTIDLTPGPRP